MSQSGLVNVKRSWSGNEDGQSGFEVVPVAGGSNAEKPRALDEVDVGRLNANSQGKVDEVIDLSTPSPEKKQRPVNGSSSAEEMGSSTESNELTSKRKLPSAFHQGKEPSTYLTNFKSARTLKDEGVKPPQLFKPGFNSFSDPKASVGKMFLSKEQRVVYDRVVNSGKNMFFTGSAGTGKSVVLREIIKGLRKKHAGKPDAVAVTASTGIAACNIGGVTLHSFAGCGLGVDPVEMLIGKIKKNRKGASRWMRTSALIIDEVSMVDPDFLDKLNMIGQVLRKSLKAFGGIQVIMTGDFFQLPPVNKGSKLTRYAFDASCWDSVVEDKVCLTQVFRQKDPDFINMLNEMRFGTLSQKSIQVFRSLTGESELERKSKMPATALYPLRQEVERANAQHLVKITQPSHQFDSIDGGTLQGEQRTKMLDNFMAPAKLRLKAGCQVMLIKNVDEQLVNGSIGTVLTFLPQTDFSKSLYGGVEWDTVDPMKMTEEEVYTMMNGKYWEAVNGISGAKIEGEASTSGKGMQQMDEKKLAQMEELEEKIRKDEKREKMARSRSSSPEKIEPTKYPVVRFLISGGRFRTELVLPEVWKNEQPNGEVVASRTQVPLILAWAMSIHKSQGQTIPIVKIDLGRVFEKGQAYVALSRAVSKEGLQVLNFNPHRVMADPRVIKWYKMLPTVD